MADYNNLELAMTTTVDGGKLEVYWQDKEREVYALRFVQVDFPDKWWHNLNAWEVTTKYISIQDNNVGDYHAN